jgi:hypothetical protein
VFKTGYRFKITNHVGRCDAFDMKEIINQYDLELDDNDHVDGVRRLRTAATNGPIVHPRVICERGEPW